MRPGQHEGNKEQGKRRCEAFITPLIPLGWGGRRVGEGVEWVSRLLMSGLAVARYPCNLWQTSRSFREAAADS